MALGGGLGARSSQTGGEGAKGGLVVGIGVGGCVGVGDGVKVVCFKLLDLRLIMVS